MGKRIILELTEAQRKELEEVRNRAPEAYLREKAAALLKVAAGELVQEVAEHGLLKRHEPETVSDWIKRYQTQGLSGLKVGKGRGRKPAFFPSTAQRSPN